MITMKKIILLLSVIMLLLLCSCARTGNNNLVTDISNSSQEQQVKQEELLKTSDQADISDIPLSVSRPQNDSDEAGSESSPSSASSPASAALEDQTEKSPSGSASPSVSSQKLSDEQTQPAQENVPPSEPLQPSQESEQPEAEQPAAAGDKTAISDPAVTFSIVCLEDVVLAAAKFEIELGDTVFDVLKRVTRERRIHLDFSGGVAAAYIKGINNVYQFDMGAESGWMYKVNGAFSSLSCGAYALQDGDVVEWLYTEELGKELGAGFD